MTALNTLTPKGVCFLGSVEAIVQEAYLDPNVWTWAMGVTNASGHEVYPRYFQKPQTLEKCLQISIWLIQNKYLPAVFEAFAGHKLNEAQVAAALSYHWNTGAIKRDQWVKDFRAGKPAAARLHMLTRLNGGLLVERRKKEIALFFDGKWPANMKTTILPVSPTRHTPRWRDAKAVDIMPMVQSIMGGS